MRLIQQFDKGISIRLFVCIALVLLAIGFFLLNRYTNTSASSHQVEIDKLNEESQQGLRATLAAIDKNVDSVLARFGIERGWIRKREVVVPNKKQPRIERRVAIPKDVVPVMMNVAFNSMAKRYNGRAVGTENSKENTITIHIEMQGYIVQTVILKPTRDLRQRVKSNGQAKI